jgi:hypothetical protein
VTSKDLFECPDEHVDAVGPLLRETNAIVVIGWRGQERTFLQLLHDSMPNPTSGAMTPALIVTNCREQAELTEGSLRSALPVLTDFRASGASSAERCDQGMDKETGFSRFVAHFADEELNALGTT